MRARLHFQEDGDVVIAHAGNDLYVLARDANERWHVISTFGTRLISAMSFSTLDAAMEWCQGDWQRQ